MKVYELEFTAYELTEDDGGGMRSYVRGYTHSLDVAKKWKGVYKSYSEKNVKHRYVVSENLSDVEKIKLDSLIESAKSKLTKEELSALLSSTQNNA
jgi:hypothetical protein